MGNTTEEYDNCPKSQQLEETETIASKHTDKKPHINTKSFTGGLQSEYTNVITGVANIDAYTTFAAEFSEYKEATHPLMTRKYFQLADV